MSPRIYREACGASGCDFVAGPSRDQNRVMRLVDEHRATGHVLEVPSEESTRQGACPCRKCLRQRRHWWKTRRGNVGRRQAAKRRRDRRELLDRHRLAAARASELAILAWSSGRICPVCQDRFTAKTARHTFCSKSCGDIARNRRRRGKDAPVVRVVLAPIRHGTDSGYSQHLQRGVPTCGACRRAHRVANDARDARRLRLAA